MKERDRNMTKTLVDKNNRRYKYLHHSDGYSGLNGKDTFLLRINVVIEGRNQCLLLGTTTNPKRAAKWSVAMSELKHQLDERLFAEVIPEISTHAVPNRGTKFENVCNSYQIKVPDDVYVKVVDDKGERIPKEQIAEGKVTADLFMESPEPATDTFQLVMPAPIVSNPNSELDRLRDENEQLKIEIQDLRQSKDNLISVLLSSEKSLEKANLTIDKLIDKL